MAAQLSATIRVEMEPQLATELRAIGELGRLVEDMEKVPQNARESSKSRLRLGRRRKDKLMAKIAAAAGKMFK